MSPGSLNLYIFFSRFKNILYLTIHLMTLLKINNLTVHCVTIKYFQTTVLYHIHWKSKEDKAICKSMLFESLRLIDLLNKYCNTNKKWNKGSFSCYISWKDLFCLKLYDQHYYMYVADAKEASKYNLKYELQQSCRFITSEWL